jgi:hypothetical protein
MAAKSSTRLLSTGSPQHIGGELFKMMTGVNMVHLPYRGGAPALTDLIGGQVQVYFASTASSIEYIKSGKVCADHRFGLCSWRSACQLGPLGIVPIPPPDVEIALPDHLLIDTPRYSCDLQRNLTLAIPDATHPNLVC